VTRRLVALLGLAVLVAVPLGLAHAGPATPGTVPAPHEVLGASAGGPDSVVAPDAPSTAASAEPSSAPSAAPQPADTTCPTPTGTPEWNVASFFSDAVVTFSVPGAPALSGSNFQTVPCNNVIPTYTNGFWMNVTTNVAMYAANVTIWGTGWPQPGNPSPDITNFAPGSPRTQPMYLKPPFYHEADFFFDVYRFFWPGSQVYFNITLQTIQATPGTIRSTESSHIVPTPVPGGGFNNATWGFYVADPWGNGQLQSSDANFSQVIKVTTSPSVLTKPAFLPNPHQGVQIALTARNPSGGTPQPIPMAQGTVTLTGPITGVYHLPLGPFNHTQLNLTSLLGPYPGDTVSFNLTAWLPWSESNTGVVGAIDEIYSPTYTFAWSAKGGWWYPAEGLAGNVEVASTPDVTGNSGSTTILDTATPVNITIHSPIQNVTIGSAAISFEYSDSSGFSTGTISMAAVTQNTSYAVLPGLPSGGTMSFSITAKDVFGNPISSGNYSYMQTGPPASNLPGGYGLFFAEGLDLSTGQLIPHVNYTIANDTWSETGIANVYGFVAPVPLGGVGYLPLAYGSYTVTLRALGAVESYSFTVSTQTPFTVVFYFASSPLATHSTVNLGPTVAFPAVIGLVGATIAMIPVVGWYMERRRKAEAEQRRITL